MAYRIVSLDGGGIRGLITSRLLERLEAAGPGMLGRVDLYAGTSTGGILALALAAGLAPDEISALYRDKGPDIFADDTILDAIPLHPDRLVVADYRNRALRAALEERFGDLRLGDLPKHVVVSAFDLDSEVVTKAGLRSWKPKFFHNFPEESDDAEQLVVNVAMRTSAAPTFFPTWQGFIDGGVAANNPSMCGLAQALDPQTGGQALEDIALLSLGTGGNPRWIEGDHDWGVLEWAPKLIDMILGGVAGVADFQCRQILGDRYARLDLVLPRAIGLDEVEAVRELEQLADGAGIDAATRWLGRYFGDESVPPAGTGSAA
jgi:uncharacterized protein